MKLLTMEYCSILYSICFYSQVILKFILCKFFLVAGFHSYGSLLLQLSESVACL